MKRRLAARALCAIGAFLLVAGPARLAAQGEPPVLVASVPEVVGTLDVASFGVEVEVTEHAIIVGPGQSEVRLVPGRVRWLPIPQSRPLTSDRSLSKWMESVLNGANFRRNIDITLLGPDGTSVASWSVINAWPSSFRAEIVGEGAAAVPTESITVVHEGFVRTR